MERRKKSKLRIAMILILAVTLAACSLTNQPVIPSPTQEITPFLSATELVPTMTPTTPAPTDTLPPLVTSTPTETATPVTPSLDDFVGYWRGDVTAQGEGTEKIVEEKVFRIYPFSQPESLALDVIQADTMRYVQMPVYDNVEGNICFALYAIQPGKDEHIYTACFSPQVDGTQVYVGEAPMWSEFGYLTRMSDAEGETLREATLASCQGNLPTRVKAGSKARVTYSDGRALNMRLNPDAEAKVLLAIPEGKEFDVINGPVCEDGYWWWFISIPGEGMGWVAEGDKESYFIEPWS